MASAASGSRTLTATGTPSSSTHTLLGEVGAMVGSELVLASAVGGASATSPGARMHATDDDLGSLPLCDPNRPPSDIPGLSSTSSASKSKRCGLMTHATRESRGGERRDAPDLED